MSSKQKRVIFMFESRSFSIICSEKDKIKDIIQQFINKCNPNSKIRDYNLSYEGNPIEPYSYEEPIGKNKLFSGKNNVLIQAEKNIKIIKCPDCNFDDCVISLKDYRTVFYNCKNKHLKYSSYNNYFRDQIYFSERIICSDCNANGKLNNPMFECLTCSKIVNGDKAICKVCIEKNHIAKKHVVINYEDKNYYCWRHIQKMKKYCFQCKSNLCEDCVTEHLKVKENKDHKIKSFDLLIPEENEIASLKNSLHEIKTNIDNLRIVANEIIDSLEDAMKLYENYYKIANHIINKYETFNKGKEDLKNFTIFKSLYKLKFSNIQISQDLKEITDKKDEIEKAETLMRKYLDKKKNFFNLDNKNIEDSPIKEDDIDWFNEVSKRERERSERENNTNN